MIKDYLLQRIFKLFNRTKPGLIFLCIVLLNSFPAGAADSCAVVMVRAEVLMRAGKYQQALSLLDQCLLRHPNNADANNLKGCTLIYSDVVNNEKNNQLAIACFDKAIGADSVNYRYYANRGWAFQNIDNFKKSGADYKRAVLLDTNNIILHGNILRNLWIMNKYKEALAYSNKMIIQFPADGYAYHVRGNLKRDYLHLYAEGNKDIKLSRQFGWRQGISLMYGNEIQ